MPKLAIAYLDYNPRQWGEEVLSRIPRNIPIHKVCELGYSYATNCGLKHFFEQDYDYVMVMDNDILMPNGFVEEMLNVVKDIPETGVCAIHCVQTIPEMKVISGHKVYPNWRIFGNYLYTRRAYELVGYMNTEQDPYGVNDTDYCYRLDRAGLINYYIHGSGNEMLKSQHLGDDVGQTTAYRKMKDEGLKKSVNVFNRWQGIYDSGDYYLPFEQIKHG
jgi:GT2 family glycosyltransferase